MNDFNQGGKQVESDQQMMMLRTLETMFELQLKAVRQLIGEEDVDVAPPRKRRARRQSLFHSAVEILKTENRSMHVNEIVTLLRERYGRVTDRDAMSSTLSKKAQLGALVKKTAPATFDLIERSEEALNE
jgi:hypothetical protein